MKNHDKHIGTTSMENTISKRLKEIAVEHGLSLPQTREEVALFEERFANEMQHANINRPSLDDLLLLTKKIKSSNESVVFHQDRKPADERYAMAARNGKKITSEIEQRMEKALDKVKSKNKINE